MKQQWEPVQWIMVNGKLVENYPARGTATINTKDGRELRDSDAWCQVSSQAQRLLYRAKEGDEGAYIDLVEEIAANVQRIALEQRWTMDAGGIRARGVAGALLSRYFGAAQTDVALASVIGISERAFRKTWRDRMAGLNDRVVKTLL